MNARCLQRSDIRGWLAASAVAVAASLGAIGTAGAQTKVLMNSYVTPVHFMVAEVLPQWAREIARVTQGRVAIEISPAPLATGPEAWNAVDNGVVDATWQMTGFVANRVRLAQIATLPWLHLGDAEASSVAYWRTQQRYFTNANEFRNVQLLSLFVATSGELSSTTDRPINSLEDLKSRKMWAVPGSPAETLRGVGVPLVSGAATAISDFVARGIVDGFWGITLESTVMFKAAPYTKTITIFPRKLFAAPFVMVMSQSKWNQISEADRRSIMQVSGETFARQVGTAWNRVEQDAKKQLLERGVKFIDGDREFIAALEKSNQAITEKWLETARGLGVNGKEALDFFRGEIARDSRFKL